MTGLPQGWASAKIPDVLAELPTGNIIDQGWSPKCENFPSESDDIWGALKTTAIQDGRFESQHTKQLPEHLEPKPALEVRAGDLLMTCAGPRVRCGVICRVERVRPKLFISGKMYRFRPNPEVVDGDFLLGALRSPDLQSAIDQIKTGGSESGLNLTQDRFRSLSLPLPPLTEQRRIVRKLDTLSARSNTARTHLTAIENLVQRYKEGVLQNAFRGKLSRDYRTLASNSVPINFDLPAEKLRKLKLQRHKLSPDEGPYSLPASWRWIALPALGELARGKSRHRPRNAKSLFGGPYPFIQTGDVSNSGGKIAEFASTYSELGLAQSRLWPTGTLCITIAANIAETGLLQFAACFPDSVVGFVADSDKTTELFIEYFIRTVRADLEAFAPGVAQKNINLNTLSAVFVPIPPLDEQREIVRRIEAAFAKIDYLAAEATKGLKLLGHLDQRILAKAFAGDLVAQDPNDEPAEILLARIRADVVSGKKTRRGRLPKA